MVIMLGLYIHWPFCLSKCIYCDFGSKVITKQECNNYEFQQMYYKCLQKQLYYFVKKIKNIESITTIYFGGGTPSLLSAETVFNIIQEAKQIFGISNNCEITLEANPTSFEIEKFKMFRQAGINRLSLGVQSMNDNNLLWLGRKHTVEQAIFAINEIKNIFEKWSFDLIYGLPKQSIGDWIDEIKMALSLKPKHLSLYTLIVDANTPLGKLVEIGNVKQKTEDELAEFYLSTNDFIKNNSKLKQYEVSNYAIEQHEGQHNLNYWNTYDYIGIGPNAHGRLLYKDGYRYEIQNICDYSKWTESIECNSNGLEVEKIINKQEQVEEILLMGLRTSYGIDIEDIQQRFKIDNIFTFINADEIRFLAKNGFLIFNDKHLCLTQKGLIILDEILRRLLK